MKKNLAVFYRSLSLLAYFGLLLTIIIWNAWLSPPEFPTAIVLIILLTPLLFGLRGLLHGKPYTYGWCSMLAIFYFVLGVADAYSDPVDRVYGLMILINSLLFFMGAILYIRSLAKAKQVK